ncbi:hypothetical protein F5Y08DRAFT_145749 [Xylaria arbuscula]|nr:hypothetical protein F5Y08DRAFT_145749 [Xylaria arbuscula]
MRSVHSEIYAYMHPSSCPITPSSYPIWKKLSATYVMTRSPTRSTAGSFVTCHIFSFFCPFHHFLSKGKVSFVSVMVSMIKRVRTILASVVRKRTMRYHRWPVEKRATHVVHTTYSCACRATLEIARQWNGQLPAQMVALCALRGLTGSRLRIVAQVLFWTSRTRATCVGVVLHAPMPGSLLPSHPASTRLELIITAAMTAS